MTTNAVTQLEFELLDIAKMLLKKQAITEGNWTVGVNFTVATVLGGPDADHVRPSAILSVNKILLSRSDEITPLTVDASKLAAE